MSTLEQYQKQCEELEGTVKQLRHGISKISIAANGIHPHLDRQLAALRREIRQESSQDTIQKYVTAITKTILKIDDEKIKQKSQVLKLLGHLVTPLNALPLSSKQRKELDSLQERLKSDDEEQKTIGKFHQVYNSIMQTLQTKSPNMSQDKQSAGLWGKLVNVSKSGSSSSNNVSICEHLIDLLKHIAVPKELEAVSDEIIKKLKGTLKDNELEHIVADISELVSRCFEMEQVRLNGFLDHLSERLDDFNQCIKIKKDSDGDGVKNAHELDTSIRDEIQRIKQNLSTTTSMDELVEGVSNNLENIGSSLKGFELAEKERRQYSQEQFDKLEERVKKAESEANELRITLSLQKHKSQHDPLTELPNREAYNEHLMEAVERFNRKFGPLSIAVADIDFFKKVNDNFGHMAGDNVLKKVASILKSNVRNIDFIARFGGEEFVILLENTSKENAYKLLEKLRAKVESCKFHFREQRVKITMSFGVYEFRDDDDPNDAFSRADDALYEAKNTGRNKVVISKA